MIKRGKGYLSGEIETLTQLVDSLDEAVLKLEDFYDKEDYDNFNKTKKFIFQIQKKIFETVK